MRDHALREQPTERLIDRRVSRPAHRAREETRVEEMQDRMLDAADILIDRQPIAHGVRVGRHARARRTEAGKVPRRIDERVHRVGLAQRIPAATRARHMLPCRMPVERIAGHVERHIVRELDRQVFCRHGHDAATLAMDHWDRAAPIALPRDAPIPQAELDLAHALRCAGDGPRREPVGHGIFGVGDAEPIEKIRIEQNAIARIGLVADGEALRVSARRQHDRAHGTPIGAREFEIALIVRGTAEDRAGAVLHQNEIGDVDGKLSTLDHGMRDAHAGIEALLLLRLQFGEARAVTVTFLDERFGFGVRLGDDARKTVIGRDRQERRAEQRIGTRGEDLDDLDAFRRGTGDRREADEQSLRAPDPVRLHQADFVGPALERVERIEQLLRVGGDLEHPFGLLALLDERAGAPAAAVDHLFVREHGAVYRVPIHLPRLAIDEPRREHVEEELLLLVVIFEIASGELAGPVERQAHALELVAHRRDIVVGPFGGMDAALDGRVLGRQAEGVPAHGVEHIVALGAHVAGDHVAHRVVPDMAHMDAAGRVWEHFQNIIFRPRIILAGLEDALGVPSRLPVLFAFRRVVAIRGHLS